MATERLNDKSNLVRLNAALSAKALLFRAPVMNKFENNSKVELIKAVMMLFLNADDEDKKIREAILGS